MKRLKDAPLESIVEAIERATAPRDRWLLERIADQVEEYNAQPARVLPGGGSVTDTHGFLGWLLLLQQGAVSLPERIPFVVLEAWKSGYKPPRPEWDSYGMGRPMCPHPLFRCEDCLTALPSRDGEWSNCPACDSTRIWRADLSRPLGVAWIDPNPVRRGAE